MRNIDLLLYQHLQNDLVKGTKQYGLYDYIICDEYHYVMTDALFNVYTDITYNWVMSQHNSIRIFMSGTGSRIFRHLIKCGCVKDNHVYKIPYDYSYANVQVFNDHNKIYEIIDRVIYQTNDKIMYFANSMDEAKEAYMRYKEYAIFKCSESSTDKRALKYNKEKKLIEISSGVTFNERILITTKVLDNGVSFVDKQIKHIICEVFDLDSHQQCLGRKRIGGQGDSCNFYIRNYNKMQIGGYKGNLTREIQPIEKLIEEGEEAYKDLCRLDRRFHSNYVFEEDNKLKYNQMAYYKLIDDIATADLMLRDGYINTLLRRLGDSINSITYMDCHPQKNNISAYLHERIGTYLLKQEQQELQNILDIKDSYNRKQVSYTKLKEYLFKNYNLNLEKKRKRIKGTSSSETVWIISEVE